MNESNAPAQAPAILRKSKLRSLTETLGDAIIPHKYRRSIINYLERASISEVPYYSYGVAVGVVLFIALVLDIIVLSTKYFVNAGIIIMILASVVIIIPILFIILMTITTFLYRLYLDAKIYYKVRKMEEAFPEFLSELSLNLKAGQSLEEALENSTEKEFGYLSEEIGRVCKKIRLGKDIELAIKEFTNNFNSDVIEESFDLIITSWKKGAQTAQLVTRIYDNLQVIRYLRKKVIASVTSYRIFLTAVTIVIAPAMFALAYHLIDLIRSMLSKVADVSTSTVFPFTINAVRINDQHFIWFSNIALVIIAVATAMITSIIKTGTIKEGYKQLIFYAVATVLSYKLFMLIFAQFFALFNV
jgi:archaellum biogenesis protein FlaJ (TadC family)